MDSVRSLGLDRLLAERSEQGVPLPALCLGVFLDITASHERRETIVQLARHCVDEVFIPFTIGGGIRSPGNAQAVLDAGADNVLVNSGAVADPALIERMTEVFVGRGAGEILLTSMDRDGTEDGYELELTSAVTGAVDVPVIASGGAGKPEHLVEAIEQRMGEAGIPVRR